MPRLANTCPCILKEGANEPRIVKAIKDQVKPSPVNPGLTQISYVDGTLAKAMKRVPKKMWKSTYISTACIYLMPHGYNYGVMNPAATRLVCTIRDLCFKDFLDQFNELKVKNDDLEMKNTTLIEKNQALKEKIDDLQSKLSMK